MPPVAKKPLPHLICAVVSVKPAFAASVFRKLWPPRPPLTNSRPPQGSGKGGVELCQQESTMRASSLYGLSPVTARAQGEERKD